MLFAEPSNDCGIHCLRTVGAALVVAVAAVGVDGVGDAVDDDAAAAGGAAQLHARMTFCRAPQSPLSLYSFHYGIRN